jgi:UDP-N-acetylglucosamine 3-dehydrogenase
VAKGHPDIIVIGGGSMGQNHLRLLSHSRLCNLVGAVETLEKTRQGIAKAYHIPVWADLEEALASVAFDAAVIATPTETHYPLAKRLLEAGKHILAEKPFTNLPATSYELLELGQRQGLTILVGHVERFNPAVMLLRKKLHELGDIYHLESERTGPFPERILSTGVGLDLLVHDADLVLAVTGAEPAWTFAYRERRVHPRHEDGLAAMLGLAGGAVAVLKANWLSPTKVRRFRIYGAKGMFEVDFLGRSLTFYENSFSDPVEDNYGLLGMEEGNQIRFKTMPSEPLANELEYFVKCINDGNLNAEMTRTNIRALEIVARVLESAERNEKIAFTDPG